MKRRNFLLSALALPIVMQLPLQQPDWEVIESVHDCVYKQATRDIHTPSGIIIPKGYILMVRQRTCNIL